eukprot:scaffold153977_cov31-Tisochrysis_lutea.AAC.1
MYHTYDTSIKQPSAVRLQCERVRLQALPQRWHKAGAGGLPACTHAAPMLPKTNASAAPTNPKKGAYSGQYGETISKTCVAEQRGDSSLMGGDLANREHG